MKAIIMAAGVGLRLRSLTGNKPKCLIMADEETLIGRMVRILKSRNINDITVITGFKSELLHEELGSQVKYVHNPLYAVTNSITSLWLAKNLLSEDVILMNADLYIEEKIMDIALAQTRHVVMLSDSSRIEDADFRFGVDGDRIIKTGNQLKNSETDCEYVGIVRIDKSFITEFKTRLEHMIQRADFRNWWEGVLYSFINEDMIIYHEDIIGTFWTEVDHLADYERLNIWLTKQQRARFTVNNEMSKLAG
jgi:choline kinase